MRLTAAKKSAFTLIELLVAVAIFSGVVVLTLGAFARSADSSLRSSAVRERTEAARTIVDRIGNDMQYVYLGKPFTSGVNDCIQSQTSLGINFDADCLMMLLHYPGTAEDKLVLHKYQLVPESGRTTIKLEEAKDCSIGVSPEPPVITCDPDRSLNPEPGDLISEKFSVDNAIVFNGIAPQQASQSDTTPLIGVTVTVKPVSFTGTCPDPTGCYTITSSFVPGG